MANGNILAGIDESEELTSGIIQPTLGLGETKFDPTGGEGGIPILTVGGEQGPSAFESFLPGTAGLAESIKTKEPQDKIIRGRSGRALPTLESSIDPVTGETILTAGPTPQEKPGGLVGKIQDTAAVGTLGALETFGVTTRALGATVKNTNPFASKEDKGKTWDEVFQDPDGGIFKEVRRIVRNSDLPGAIKFIIEIGISIPEEPLALISALAGVGKSVVRQSAKRTAIKKETADIAPGLIKAEGQADVLAPSGSVNLFFEKNQSRIQSFTPAQREFIETGTVSPEIALREITAIKKAPEVKQQLDAGRSDNITSNIANVRKKHGLTDTNEGGTLFGKVEVDVDKAVAGFRKEVNELYKGINQKADPSILGEKTKKIVNDNFERLGIREAKKFNDIEVAQIVKQVMIDGHLKFGTGKGGSVIPFDGRTGRELTKEALEKESRDAVLGASDLGLTPRAFALLKNVKKSLSKENRTLGNLRKNKTTIQDAIQEARRSGQSSAVAILEQAREALKKATRTQIDEVIGDPALTREWMIADDFMTQNASGVKAAGNLMFDKAGNPRSATGIIREFSKVPTRKKGAVIDNMMDFFDEPALQNLRNLYFNDIIEKSSKGGFTGQKLRNVINSQPESVFNKVFTTEMKQDMSDLLADAISDDLAKEITRAKLGKFSVADKQSVLRKMFANPAYRIWATTAGFTKASLKRLSLLGLASAVLGIAEGRAVRSASSFLKETSDQGLTNLTFKALKEGAEVGGRRRPPVTPTVLQRKLTEETEPQEQTAGGLLEGL